VPAVAPSHTRLLLASSVLLTLTAAILADASLRLSGDHDTIFIVLLVVPGSATAAFLAIGIVVPNLVGISRLRWPLMVTLPVVYGALLQLCAALWSRGPNPIVRLEPFSRASEFWQSWVVAGSLLVCQIVVLGAWSLLAGRISGPE
jgi:RsiW-degrading membrane proteinase PrsW (M82 family)